MWICNKMIQRYLFFVLLLCTSSHAANPVSVVDPWIREAPPNMHHLAAYMSIENQSGQTITLAERVSEQFMEIEIHKTSMEDGMASMDYVEELDLLPNKVVAFKPGAYHLMLMGPKRPLKDGDQVEINLVFSGGQTIPVVFMVRREKD